MQSVQIIFNAFRLRPAELFFEVAKRKQVAVIARVPLASGLLSGRFTRDTEFPAADHRAFNRDGAGFDRGETFSGVDYEVGLAAVERLRPLVPPGATLAQFALRWILSFEAVSCVIPGARRGDQVDEQGFRGRELILKRCDAVRHSARTLGTGNADALRFTRVASRSTGAFPSAARPLNRLRKSCYQRAIARAASSGSVAVSSG